MGALKCIIYFVVVILYIPNGNSEGIETAKVNLTAGHRGLLKCLHPLKINNNEVVAYWKKEDDVICYEKLSMQTNMQTSMQPKCPNLEHHIADKEIVLTIPKVNASDAGNYTCFVSMKEETFECRIKLTVITARGRSSNNSNGVHKNAGPIFLIYPLAVMIWNLPFLLL